MPVSQPPFSLPLPAGMRATRAVQALLSLLPQQQPQVGWSESAVEAALAAQGVVVNRVTVYRALERLTQAGVLRRTVDGQRLTRYWVAQAIGSDTLAHLECRACHQSMSLDVGSEAVQAALHSLQQALAQSTGISTKLDVTIQAECAQCAVGGASSAA